MPNIVILTNRQQYPYHPEMAAMAQSALQQLAHSVTVLDINSEKYGHVCLARLKETNPDILITFDLAGFCFRTQSGENALNMLCTKNLNILWGNKPEYAPLLSKKISLSMLFYDASGTDSKLPLLYPNLLYYKVSSPIKQSAVSASDIAGNTNAFLSVWEDFTREVLLSET